MIYWVIGFLIAISSLSVYLEYASYFSNRSGSEVVYLEQAYPRPRYLFPTAFAVQSVILSFSSGNSIVLANYLFRINGHVPSPWELKGVAVAGYTVAVLLLAFNTRFGYLLSNGIGIVKLLTLIFVAITGLVVLGGHTRVHDPKSHFAGSFEGTSNQPYGLTNALVKIIFSYAGYENAFNVVNEVKVCARYGSRLVDDYLLSSYIGPRKNHSEQCINLSARCRNPIHPRQRGIHRCSTNCGAQGV